MCGMLVWCNRWEQLSSWAPPRTLTTKGANHNRLAALRLEYVYCPLFIIYIYAKNFLKIKDCPIVKLNGWCDHKGHFYMNLNKYFTFTKTNISDAYAKFSLEQQPLPWSQYPHMSSQQHKNMTTSTLTFLSTFWRSPNCMTRVSMGRYPCWL